MSLTHKLGQAKTHAARQVSRTQHGVKVGLLTLALAASSCQLLAAELPTPKDILGHTPGEDFYLANYEDSLSYFHALAAKSDKIKMFKAGQSTHGKTLEFAVISSPENLAKWEEYKAISLKLADSRGLTDAEARKLAKESKIIVHIDGGMHSSEVADHQLPIRLAHTMLTSKDPKIAEYLDKVILVLWPTLNPDGQDMVVDWYRSNVGGPHETSPMPWLYQEYVGHDNNRDGYMLNMKESQVVTAAVQENAPAIFYAQHQKAPFPARIWVPPFSDPISQNIDPMMRNWTSLIGMHMIGEFESQQLPGAIAQARFDNWYPGFLDYTHVFRHTISYFTEVALHEYATPWTYDPAKFPDNRKDLKPQIMYPSPWKGGKWTIDDAIHYMEVASLSTLDTAARYSEQIQYDRYQAGRDTIARYKNEGPYAYVISATQHDLSEAGALVNILLQQQIEVYQLQKNTELNGKRYPADSWVIPMDQPYAGLVQELFEKQQYPASFLDKNGLPENLPYDTTGWTLPLQMGVEAAAVTEPLSKSQKSRLKAITAVSLPAGVTGRGDVFVVSQSENAAYKLANLALANGATVVQADNDKDPSFFISDVDKSKVDGWAKQVAVAVKATSKVPKADKLTAARVGLYRPWKPSMDEGWTRWLMEQYQFPLTTLHNADVKAGNLADKVDVIILPDINLSWLMDGFSGKADDAWWARNGGAKIDAVPAKYQGGIGADGAQALRDFVARGGRLVAFNNASSAAIKVLGLPVTNVLEGVGSDVFYCSGALLQLELNKQADSTALAGLAASPVAMFSHGPAFTTLPGFEGDILASYPKEGNPLLSGVLLHPEAINGKAAAVKVKYGKGEVYLYGFQPQWRGQSHGTYKFVFNALYR
ncbi:M14 family metallopeptidase [Shewanella mangrovi]|uniref:M14 family metallopeptidase n=1 Tax=Shewanella mangrovi TaxID=1515746 RepID=UPI0009DD9386|nr:M14 metallopeptidase family protein [Shewanella mangrovi]